ncbi:MAG TPA: zf-HC2 domain-containing protein [Chthonomonadaceae bacterium]|nr:zf-HC2 domain-containing protein [Chthonomonadaceae bacterium]
MAENAAYPCEEVQARLDDYLDQELAPEETRRMLEHLDTCADCAALCRRAYEELAEMRARMQDFQVPAALQEDILRTLAESLPNE